MSNISPVFFCFTFHVSICSTVCSCISRCACKTWFINRNDGDDDGGGDSGSRWCLLGLNDGYGSGLGNGSGLDSCGGRYPAGVQTAHVCMQLHPPRAISTSARQAAGQVCWPDSLAGRLRRPHTHTTHPTAPCIAVFETRRPRLVCLMATFRDINCSSELSLRTADATFLRLPFAALILNNSSCNYLAIIEHDETVGFVYVI